jgi:hypothetical protein
MSVRQNSFYKHIAPPDVGQLCPELSAALLALQQVESVRVVAMGYANSKMPEFVAVLDHEPSAMAIAEARSACSKYPHVNFVDEGIGCAQHWSELFWDDHLSQPANLKSGSLLDSINRVLRRFGKKVVGTNQIVIRVMRFLRTPASHAQFSGGVPAPQK